MLLLILVNFFTPNLWIIIALLTVLSWLATSRLVRGEVLPLCAREFVQAAQTMGSSRRWIMLRHLMWDAVASSY